MAEKWKCKYALHLILLSKVFSKYENSFIKLLLDCKIKSGYDFWFANATASMTSIVFGSQYVHQQFFWGDIWSIWQGLTEWSRKTWDFQMWCCINFVLWRMQLWEKQMTPCLFYITEYRLEIKVTELLIFFKCSTCLTLI